MCDSFPQMECPSPQGWGEAEEKAGNFIEPVIAWAPWDDSASSGVCLSGQLVLDTKRV